MGQEITQLLLITLLGLIGWLGVRIFAKLDEIQKCLKDKERDLRLEIAKLWTALREVQVMVGRRKSDVQDSGAY
ncbi:MAG: hypothetical protein LBK01_06850 [Burkholderiaceae bacterium]|jgi:hypothetical protein|nr:hypothetical protein [Burkholderiaceae bacterium]